MPSGHVPIQSPKAKRDWYHALLSVGFWVKKSIQALNWTAVPAGAILYHGNIAMNDIHKLQRLALADAAKFETARTRVSAAGNTSLPCPKSTNASPAIRPPAFVPAEPIDLKTKGHARNAEPQTVSRSLIRQQLSPSLLP
jgi:hypothetical protein